MDKLLQLIGKLRNEIVPEQPLSKMSKPDLLKFIEEAQILERMRTFHEKGSKGIRSTITEDDDEQLIPGSVEIQRWRVGKLRKLLRDFHRATQILKKFTKYTSGRLRSHNYKEAQVRGNVIRRRSPGCGRYRRRKARNRSSEEDAQAGEEQASAQGEAS